MLTKKVQEDNLSVFTSIDDVIIRPMEESKIEMYDRVIINIEPELFPFYIVHVFKSGITEYWVTVAGDYDTTKQIHKSRYLQLRR